MNTEEQTRFNLAREEANRKLSDFELARISWWGDLMLDGEFDEDQLLAIIAILREFHLARKGETK
jgi:hypothetical protein